MKRGLNMREKEVEKKLVLAVKAPGERPRPLQVSRHRLLMRLGFRVYVLDDPEQIGGILDEIQST